MSQYSIKRSRTMSVVLLMLLSLLITGIQIPLVGTPARADGSTPAPAPVIDAEAVPADCGMRCSNVGGSGRQPASTTVPDIKDPAEDPKWNFPEGGLEGKDIFGEDGTKAITCEYGEKYGDPIICNGAGAATEWKRFPSLGYKGPGNAYNKDVLPYRLEISVAPKRWKYDCSYTVYDKVMEPVLDENGVKIGEVETGETVPRLVPQDCWHSSPGTSQPFVSNNASKYEYTALINSHNCSLDVYIGAPAQDEAGAYKAPFVGYRLDWEVTAVNTSRTMTNPESTYECIKPAVPEVGWEACYTMLGGDIVAEIPDSRLWTEPPTRPGTPVTQIGEQKWRITPDPVTLQYKALRDSRADGVKTLDVCKKERAGLSWNYNEDFSKTGWGWGTYDTQLWAPYDEVYVLRFPKGDAVFGTQPPDKIVWRLSRFNVGVATWDNPAHLDRGRVMRSKVYLYCAGAELPNDDAGAAREFWWYGNSYWTPSDEFPNGKPAPANLTFTINDCAPPHRDPDPERAVSGNPASWICGNPRLNWYGIPGKEGVPLLADADGYYAIEGQADNLGRTLLYNAPAIRAANGGAIANQDNETVTWLALPDSSPRLKNHELDNSPSQPFRMTPNLDKKLPATTDWAATEDRSLMTQFKEASRDGKTFSVYPKFEFTMDLRIDTQGVTTFNTQTGVASLVTDEVWIYGAPGECEGSVADISVLRVGNVPFVAEEE